jgi:hypothetical protein
MKAIPTHFWSLKVLDSQAHSNLILSFPFSPNVATQLIHLSLPLLLLDLPVLTPLYEFLIS